MSVVAVSDILLGDLLTETGMKPWWEKVRGYILASGVAMALSSTYLTLNGVPLDCLPQKNENINGTCIIDEVQAAWTNTYCSIKIPWYIRFSGGMSLLAVVIMLAVSTYWLHIPEVIDSFASFAEMVRIISDCNMALADLCEMSLRPLKREDVSCRQLKLRQVCEEILNGGRKDIILNDVYRRRNYLLLGASVVVASTFTLIVYFMISLGDEFRCNISTNNICMRHGEENLPETVVCVSSMANHLTVFNVLFIISVVMQTLPIVYFVIEHGGRVSNKRPIQPGQLRNVDFLSFFWQCAQPTWSAKFSGFVDYVSGSDAEVDILNSLEKAVLLGDDYVIRSFFVVKNFVPETASQILIHRMYGLHQSALNENTRKDIEDVESKIASAIDKYIHAETLEMKYQKFLKNTRIDTNWKLTTGIVNQYVRKLITTEDDPTVNGYNLLQKLHIDYDILDDNGCSIMHYFLAMPNMRTISELLSKQYKETRGYELYEHYDGKSALVSGRNDINMEILKNLAGANYSDSRHCLKHYNDKFILSLRGEASVDRAFIHGLSRIKFREWDTNAKDFAINAYQRKDWRTFVTLVNCYIIPDENEGGYFPLACGVTEGMDTAAFLEALRYPKPFVGTAAKHIIACFTPDQREEAGEIIDHSELRNDYRNMLKQFIREYDSTSD